MWPCDIGYAPYGGVWINPVSNIPVEEATQIDELD